MQTPLVLNWCRRRTDVLRSVDAGTAHLPLRCPLWSCEVLPALRTGAAGDRIHVGPQPVAGCPRRVWCGAAVARSQRTATLAVWPAARVSSA